MRAHVDAVFLMAVHGERLQRKDVASAAWHDSRACDARFFLELAQGHGDEVVFAIGMAADP